MRHKTLGVDISGFRGMRHLDTQDEKPIRGIVNAVGAGAVIWLLIAVAVL